MRSLFYFFLGCLPFVYADCPVGYSPSAIYNQKYCYKVYTTFYDRQQAVSQCAQDGATLATISSEEENQMYIAADQVTGSLTFGLSCTDNNHCAFDDGTPFNSSSYNKFAGGLVRTDLGRCVALETVGAGTGKWSNIPCTLFGSFVCRYTLNSYISQQSGCNNFYLVQNINSANAVKVTSPHYPQNYDNFETCSYFFQTGYARLKITFTDFYTENGPDVVRVYDGGALGSNATLIGIYSGSRSSFTVITQTNEALITFTTDVSVTYRGFSATIVNA